MATTTPARALSWRLGFGALLVWALMVAQVAAAGAAAGAREVRAFVLTVADLDRSVAFYEQALGFARIAERTTTDPALDAVTGVPGTRLRTATLRLGDESVELDQYLAPPGRAIPADSRAVDLWFQHFAIVVSDMDRAHAHLSRFGVETISTAPQTLPEWNIAAAGVRAYKFRDPDGHPLELLFLPPGKGNPKWQSPTDRLFLGIDHSAITVTDTARSTDFYRGLLGLHVLGGSLNSGPTQEQLDDTPGAVVQVTGLHPASADGPGVELLQYLTPGAGRPFPADARADDLVHARTVIETDDLEPLAARLRQARVPFVSTGVVRLPGHPYRRQLLVRDPDGHAVLLVQP